MHVMPIFKILPLSIRMLLSTSRLSGRIPKVDHLPQAVDQGIRPHKRKVGNIIYIGQMYDVKNLHR